MASNDDNLSKFLLEGNVVNIANDLNEGKPSMGSIRVSCRSGCFSVRGTSYRKIISLTLLT
jgi:hypothetical protein